jgi:hypothetical protein
MQSRQLRSIHYAARARFRWPPLSVPSEPLQVLRNAPLEGGPESLRGQSTPRSRQGDRLPVQRSGVEPRRRSTNLHQIPEDLCDLFRIGDHGNHLHGRVAVQTLQRIDFVHLGNQPGPGATAFLIRNNCFVIARLYRFRSLQAFGFPSGWGKADHMRHIRSIAFGAGSIQSVPPNILRSTRWDMLCKFQQKTGH